MIFSTYFFRRLERHPARTVGEGILLVFAFQAVSYWVRQAGILSALRLPVSIYSPTIGYEMFVGPFTEITSSLYQIEKWKVVLIWGQFLVMIAEFASGLILEKKSQSLLAIKRFTRIGVFLSLPALWVPTNYINSSLLAACSVLAMLLIYGSLRFFSKQAQTLSILLGVALVLVALQNSFNEGQKIAKDCSVQVAITHSPSSGSVTEVGCWISSSDKYLIITVGSSETPIPRVIYRDRAVDFKFLERGAL